MTRITTLLATLLLFASASVARADYFLTCDNDGPVFGANGQGRVELESLTNASVSSDASTTTSLALLTFLNDGVASETFHPDFQRSKLRLTLSDGTASDSITFSVAFEGTLTSSSGPISGSLGPPPPGPISSSVANLSPASGASLTALSALSADPLSVTFPDGAFGALTVNGVSFGVQVSGNGTAPGGIDVSLFPGGLPFPTTGGGGVKTSGNPHNSPEPSSLILASLGAVGLLAGWRRGKKGRKPLTRPC